MKLLQCLLVLCVLAIPLSALAEKAKTIDELAKMYDSKRCADCHEEIYKQWENSHHSRPLNGIPGLLNMDRLAQPGRTAFSPDKAEDATIENYRACLKCHLPQAVTKADDSVAVELTKALNARDFDKINQLKITCVVCHNDMAIIHKLEEGEPGAKTLYSVHATAEHDDERFATVKKSSIMTHPVMCGQCHGQGPNFDLDNPVQCGTAYGSYMHAYLAGGGTQTCQQCHMKPVDGQADHTFKPNFNDRQKTEALLRKTISLDVETLAYEWIEDFSRHVPKIVVNTRIASRAGHRVPDG